MKKQLFLSVLLLVCTFVLSSCASDSSTDPNNNNNNNNNGNPTVPLGTLRVKWDGVLKTYTVSVNQYAVLDSVLIVDAQDPDILTARFRMFIYNPKVGTFPVQMLEGKNVALIQGIKAENGSASAVVAHNGTVKLTTFEGKHFAGTFSFTGSADGTTNGTQVQGTEGEFNLNTL
jgi:hypothetical protein